jgi:hypothetical protein
MYVNRIFKTIGIDKGLEKTEGGNQDETIQRNYQNRVHTTQEGL